MNRLHAQSSQSGNWKESALLSLFIVLAFFLSSCSGSSVSRVKGSLSRNIRVALAPSGGVLADAIGVELFNRGFTIFDTNQMSNVMVRLNITEVELSLPKNLELLKQEGIDAVLSVKGVAGYDGRPQSASVRVNNTATGEVLAGLSWQNGWGGQAGSIADRMKRKDLSEAAIEIVDNLLKE